jgi:hypothetical protein
VPDVSSLPAITSGHDQNLLGRESDDPANEEIEAMRRHAAAMADLLIDMFLTQRATQR